MFLVVKALNAMKREKGEDPRPSEAELLTEIRDLLRAASLDRVGGLLAVRSDVLGPERAVPVPLVVAPGRVGVPRRRGDGRPKPLGTAPGRAGPSAVAPASWRRVRLTTMAAPSAAAAIIRP